MVQNVPFNECFVEATISDGDSQRLFGNIEDIDATLRKGCTLNQIHYSSLVSAYLFVNHAALGTVAASAFDTGPGACSRSTKPLCCYTLT